MPEEAWKKLRETTDVMLDINHAIKHHIVQCSVQHHAGIIPAHRDEQHSTIGAKQNKQQQHQCNIHRRTMIFLSCNEVK